ncbi:hypothetical protein QBC44DRAFT_368703 [Cladorrhinum sp. PSN332]|nr:hypothetical protein QBC44DRAFT_368703 [Cladorrhinum sp. PSN332]
MGITDRIMQKLNRTRSMNHLVAPDPSSPGEIYSGVTGGPHNPWYGAQQLGHVGGPNSHGTGAGGGPMLGAIPETDTQQGRAGAGGPGGYYHPSSRPSSPPPNPSPQSQRPKLNGTGSGAPKSTGFVFGRGGAGNYKNPKKSAPPKPSSRESLPPLESATSSSTATTANTHQTEETRHSFSGVSSASSKPPSSSFPKPDAGLSGHSTSGGDFSDPKASNAEVQRCIKLLRQLFELRIKIWGMRKAHWSTRQRRMEVKRQARDLHRDINQIVVDWQGMPRSTWTVEEAEIIYAIGKELEGLVPFWDEMVEVDSPNS